MNPLVQPDYSTMAVKELRAILQARNVDYSECIEKCDLVKKIHETADKDPLTISINQATELVFKSKSVACFTGAGMSVESGIPDFRSRGGLWEKFDPSIYASYAHFLKQPQDTWEMMAECANVIDSAKPNAGHLALVTLEEMGLLKAILTQNIDGLHQDAGNKTVYELHGGCKTATCIDCKKSYTISEIKTMLDQSPVPKCVECSSDHVKIDVILFGEALPPGIMEKSMDAVSQCDLLIVIGSSLQVAPANMLPEIAKQHGASILLINMSPTPLDDKADVVVHGPVAQVLPRIVQQVKAKF